MRFSHGVLVASLLTAGLTAAESHRPVTLAADWVSARLVANAGFEEAGLASWTSDAPAGAVSVVGTPVHSGGQALKVTDSSSTGGLSVRGRSVAVVPGETLTARAWAQRTDQNAGTLYLEYWRADGSRIDDATAGRDVAAVAGWQAVAVGATAPADAVTATVLVYSKQGAVGSTVWDDVTLDSAPPPIRKVPNGDFEALRETPKPTSWAVTGSANLVGSPVHNGNRALRTDDSSSTGAVTALSKAVPVTSGETLTVTVQTRTVSGLAGSLYLEFRRADGSSEDSYKTHKDVTAGADWHALTVAKKAPADATSATVRIYSAQDAVGSTLWDDVTIKSDRDTPYAAGVGSGSVLFVGDQRVESYTGMSRQVIKGTPKGDPALPDGDNGVVLGGGTWDANPRVSGTVLRDPDGTWKLWYNAAPGMGYATSTDGVKWTRFGSRQVADFGPGGVVENPKFNPADPAGLRYYTLYPKAGDYYAAGSRDGIAWQTLNSGNHVLPGFDVVNATYDPVSGRYVAMTKNYPASAPYGPRDIWLSYSTDFVRWTSPEYVFGTDVLDNEKVAAANPGKADAVSEIYGMPGIRYGEQYLGVPWMFDITEVPAPNGDPGPDKGRAHLELIASQDLVSWSRPARDALITDRGPNSWDWGFQMGGTSLVPAGDDVHFYYGSFAGEHSCAANQVPGLCRKATGNSKVGLVTWKRDRFVAFRAAAGGGSVTTRTLAPTGNRVTVNAAPGAGRLRVEVLDAGGVPVPGYTAADASVIMGDTLGTTVSWGAKTTLPSAGGPFRLRFDLTAGDLYSYTIA
ncbi:MAG: carbohydrate binding domain-containing protein [Kibdelosporangium sp.]